MKFCHLFPINTVIRISLLSSFVSFMPFPLKFRLLSSALMSLMLGGLMTGWVTWLNMGFASDFLPRWGKAFVCAWPAAFFIVVLIGPSVQRLSLHLLQHSSGHPARQADNKPH